MGLGVTGRAKSRGLARRGSVALALALAALPGAGCELGPPALELHGVAPDIGPDALPTPVTLLGAFPVPVETDLMTGRGLLRQGFSAWVGEVPMDGVSLRSSSELEAVMPRGLSPGFHDVAVEDPLGRRVRLEAAFLVVADDGAGPRVEILQPPEGDRVPAGGAFIVRYRATERQPARVAAVDYNVEVGRTPERRYVPAEPTPVVDGFFVVEVPVFSEQRRVRVEVIAWDDAPDPSHGGARVDVVIDNCRGDGSCDDGLFCDGRERCDDGWCRPGEPVDCADAFECTFDECDEEQDRCVHLPRHELCDDGLACTGVETCTTEVGCVAGAPPCADGVGCTLDGCDEETLECRHEPSDERCDDGLFCNGEERCDPVAGCRPGVPPCQDGLECTEDRCNELSRSCSHVPVDALCAGSDPCTADRCDLWLGCVHARGEEGPVGSPSCADGLDSDCDGRVDDLDPGCAAPPCIGVAVLPGEPGRSTVEVDLCAAGLDPALVRCESLRNETLLASWDFEGGTAGLRLDGDVAPSAEAQAHLRPGTTGLRLCGDGAAVEASVDARGHRGLGLRLAAASESLGDGEYLEVLFSVDGGASDWSQLLVLGDGLARPSLPRLLLLPSTADGREALAVRVEVTGGAGCGLLDEFAVVDLPAASSVRDLVVESFDAGFGGLMVHDPSGASVARAPAGAGSAAELESGSGAWVGAFLREPLARPEEGVVLSLLLGGAGLGPGSYGLVQWSFDRGASWVEVAGVGLDRPAAAAAVGAVLEPIGGLEELQVRVVAPATALGGGRVVVDDLTIRAADPALVDEIGPFVDAGDGTYRAELETAVPGLAELRCGYLTSGFALWSPLVVASL